MKRKEEFLYKSLDIDVAEMQAGNSHVQYLKFRLFDKFVSPIANSSHLETSPSTSESKHVGGAIADQLHTVVRNISSTMTDFSKMLQKMSTAITDLSINVKQLLLKSNEREQPHQFD
ncbi:hypothetical protein MS3_00000482 [Schistosoma haematobium]|uniref:Uncharacterized protein n=1 Tax=Schistosoma haematobium TaxID=6185 RepID=A0A922S5P5_SCHHA|nr:hypothetical protein MS3_00000482 [Schistosoma haematobium]KAH9594769.1 hypothetical protein MS3_00000482 [Schistosoma haematobium]